MPIEKYNGKNSAKIHLQQTLLIAMHAGDISPAQLRTIIGASPAELAAWDDDLRQQGRDQWEAFARSVYGVDTFADPRDGATDPDIFDDTAVMEEYGHGRSERQGQDDLAGVRIDGLHFGFAPAPPFPTGDGAGERGGDEQHGGAGGRQLPDAEDGGGQPAGERPFDGAGPGSAEGPDPDGSGRVYGQHRRVVTIDAYDSDDESINPGGVDLSNPYL